MNVKKFDIIFSRLREESGLTQDEIAKKLGVSKSTVGMWEIGKRLPSPELYEQIADFFNVDMDYLYGRTDIRQKLHYDNDGVAYVPVVLPPFPNIRPITKQSLPVLGEVACGEPKFMNEEIEFYADQLEGIHADFVLIAKGDSMTGARIHDGDLVFIRKQEEVENGEIAAVAIGDEATLKRVYYYSNKSLLVLRAENPNYKDMEYSGQELEGVRILGKAVAFQSDVK